MYAVLLFLLTYYLSIDTTEIGVAAGEGKHPISLLIIYPGAALQLQELYIFTHTTVQDFLDVVDDRFDYIYEGEVINEIPKSYFMITLGLHSGSIIEKTIPKPEENTRDDEEYVEHNMPREYRV